MIFQWRFKTKIPNSHDKTEKLRPPCYEWPPNTPYVQYSVFLKFQNLIRLFHERLIQNSMTFPRVFHFYKFHELFMDFNDFFHDLETDLNSWWRYQMETFSALLAICAGNSPVPGEFPSQRPVTRSFDIFFDLRLNKRLSKQSWGWWFETLSRSLWRHRNVLWFFKSCGNPGLVFCLGVSSGCARPTTGEFTSVTWPVIGWA